MNRVLLVDDHQVVRDGLKEIVREALPDPVFGETGTAPEAVRLATEQDWDLAVVDISLGGRSGLDLLGELKRVRPAMQVLVLSMHPGAQYARRAYRLGASGYITKDRPRAELVAALLKVRQGGRYISPELAEQFVLDIGRDHADPPHHALSDRELEVLRQLGAGKTVGEIAALLNISDKTVSTYKARIQEKTALKGTAELIRYAIEHGLVP
jgi:two-component system invasion response regulator UvrY